MVLRRFQVQFTPADLFRRQNHSPTILGAGNRFLRLWCIIGDDMFSLSAFGFCYPPVWGDRFLRNCFVICRWLELLLKTNYIDEAKYQELDNVCSQIRVMLIKSINTAKGDEQ